uniref:SCP domain-containing protein n=1 Tax=Rhabditophanes sp. KR3021 TaxID=114890 RepID=A0AC35TYY7_9BILA
MSDYASTSNIGVPSCGITCHEDYITFMPMPVVSKDCSDAISPPDQRMITNDFTTRIYVSPPDVPYDCNEMFTTTVYDKNDNGHQEVISSIGTSTIELTDKSEMASSSNSGQLPMYRLGSILNYPDSLTAYGHFAHYVPSIQEWVTGKTQFYTFAKGCYIEMYADQNGLNPDAIKMDGLPLSSYGYKLNHMNHFTKTYGHFIVPVTGYGLHTIESGANYVMYVICKNVLGAYDAAGYVAGFNKRKVQDSD